MITSWTLCNFKSVREMRNLPLAPLTVLAGENSSGKSTLIQSMLLVSQTLSSKVGTHPIVLNGHLAKLGQFADLKSVGGKSNVITIGWECSVRPLSLSRRWRANALLGRSSAATLLEESQRISCEVSFGSSVGAPRKKAGEAELAQLYPRLSEVTLRRRAPSGQEADSARSLGIGALAGSVTGRIAELMLPKSDVARGTESIRYLPTLDSASRAEIDEELGFGELDAQTEPAGCALRHFLPRRLDVAVRLSDTRAQEIVTLLYELCETSGRMGLGFSPRRFQTTLGHETEIPASVCKVLEELVGKAIVSHLQSYMEARTPSLRGKQAARRNLSISVVERQDLATMLSTRQVELFEVVRDAFVDIYGTKSRMVGIPLPGGIDGVVDYFEGLFSANLKYLGPLRDEPRALYPLAPTADPTDVGLRGENTAAVLELNKNRPVTNLRPEQLDSVGASSAPSKPPLKEAVRMWLEHIGVGHRIDTKDMGRLGHEMKVQVTADDDTGFHDLTHVGVGVSQVLPILVSSLLAEPDSVLLFEQPELHLHPRVQSLLADFFLAMATLGKQCIIETHSEHLINRLRLRSALAEGGSVTNLLQIYFAKRSEGVSVFTPVKVNEYGAIANWPEGFFDQAELEAERILNAAMAKRDKDRK